MNALRQHKFAVAAFTAAGAVLGTFVYAATARAHREESREITIRGDQFAFNPQQIEVRKDDLVKITFTAVDIPHSFNVEGYRIAKRAGAGQTVVLEFRADRAGEHAFYCDLAQDDRCRQMKGKLLVK
jgi:heme/copper-type cytochrome/quinol oxidase subunit 2